MTLELILELVLGVRDPGLRARLGRDFETLQTPANNLALFLPQILTRRAAWNRWVYRPLDRARRLLG